MIETPSEQIRPAVVRVSGRRETILKLFLFGFSLIMVCCLTEFASWLYLKQHFGKFGYSLQVQSLGSMAENAYQVWEDPANYTNWSLRAHFDEHGLRYPTPVSVQKPVGVRRIFILGGSMAYGSQPSGMWQKFSGQRELAINETVAGSMEQVLKERHPGVQFQVINAATNWAKLHQQMIRYLRQLKDFSPDLIVSIDGQNDSTLHSATALNGWEETEQLYDQEVLWTNKYRLRPLMSRSNALYLFAMLAFKAHDADVDPALVNKYEGIQRPANYDQSVADYYQKYWAGINKRVAEYNKTMRYFHEVLAVDGVPHLFVLQPLIHLDRTKPLTSREKAIRGYIYSTATEYYWRDNFYRLVTNEKSRLEGESGVPFETMLDPFDGVTQDAYTDYCHLTPAGDRVFAEKLMARLESRYPALFR